MVYTVLTLREAYPGGIYPSLTPQGGIPGCIYLSLTPQGGIPGLYLSLKALGSLFVGETGSREPYYSRFTVGRYCQHATNVHFWQKGRLREALSRAIFPFHCWSIVLAIATRFTVGLVMRDPAGKRASLGGGRRRIPCICLPCTVAAILSRGIHASLGSLGPPAHPTHSSGSVSPSRQDRRVHGRSTRLSSEIRHG